MKIVDDDPKHALDPTSDIFLMQNIFDASSASKRSFSEIHYLYPNDPDLTIGMGHWIRGNISRLFESLRNDPGVWNKLMANWSSLLDKDQWVQLRDETGISSADQQALEEALHKVLCIGDDSGSCIKSNLEPWADKVGEKFNSKNHWFAEGWLSISQLEPVAMAQVEFWKKSVLIPGTKSASKRGLTTRGGIACVISAKSSGLGSTMFKIGAKKVSASKGGVSRKWSLTKFPQSALPDEHEQLSQESLLQDWKAVVAWQYYTVKKKRVRSRMRAIWSEFFEDAWGPLKNPNSVSDSTKVPVHSGVFMEKRPFNFSVVLS